MGRLLEGKSSSGASIDEINLQAVLAEGSIGMVSLLISEVCYWKAPQPLKFSLAGKSR